MGVKKLWVFVVEGKVDEILWIFTKRHTRNEIFMDHHKMVCRV